VGRRGRTSSDAAAQRSHWVRSRQLASARPVSLGRSKRAPLDAFRPGGLGGSLSPSRGSTRRTPPAGIEIAATARMIASVKSGRPDLGRAEWPVACGIAQEQARPHGVPAAMRRPPGDELLLIVHCNSLVSRWDDRVHAIGPASACEPVRGIAIVRSGARVASAVSGRRFRLRPGGPPLARSARSPLQSG
jgi:hypothetical protein